MMIRRRFLLLVLLTVVGIAAAGADTFAVLVRSMTVMEDRDELPELLAGVEEGVMDALFNAGHIVFDIVPGEDPEQDRLQAAQVARQGGARYLVLVRAEFELERTRGVIPALSTATLVDLRTNEESAAVQVEAGLLPRYYELSPQDMALLLGAAAVESVLHESGEVDSQW